MNYVQGERLKMQKGKLAGDNEKSGTQFPLPFSLFLPIFSAHEPSLKLTETIPILPGRENILSLK